MVWISFVRKWGALLTLKRWTAERRAQKGNRTSSNSVFDAPSLMGVHRHTIRPNVDCERMHGRGGGCNDDNSFYSQIYKKETEPTKNGGLNRNVGRWLLRVLAAVAMAAVWCGLYDLNTRA